ncbi:hypothetical protein LS68_002375 [Helicobacter sp. MIT 05-5293]|uniref:Lipoprotein n=1 Tax=uncultured Helicobacter sp. TaxID=175537 RepID=A0A650EJZ0_9HELI|nr:hypothetical protein [Helicobacter sp. MIT 05-5293]QGT49896.1 hypothetical protein Helico4rc_0150 [uncultured Helicobacter sp.]TLD81882.1 hypothetical protein LS68_002375 [Helicobacter sp. MIT 05-5293]
MLRTFHKGILAYLAFIFLIGCGYKADPFYKQIDSKIQSPKQSSEGKKVLFYGIDTYPTYSDEDLGEVQ